MFAFLANWKGKIRYTYCDGNNGEIFCSFLPCQKHFVTLNQKIHNFIP